jgi:hypothetical protein
MDEELKKELDEWDIATVADWANFEETLSEIPEGLLDHYNDRTRKWGAQNGETK